jgi:hypothetical protein
MEGEVGGKEVVVEVVDSVAVTAMIVGKTQGRARLRVERGRFPKYLCLYV